MRWLMRENTSKCWRFPAGGMALVTRPRAECSCSASHNFSSTICDGRLKSSAKLEGERKRQSKFALASKISAGLRNRPLVYAEILHVNVAAQARVEEQIPAGMVIIVIDVHAVTLPFPVAATVQVVRSNDPVRVVVEHYATSTVVD